MLKMNERTQQNYPSGRALMRGHEKFSVFRTFIIFTYPSKHDPLRDATHTMYSNDFLDERHGPSKEYKSYTAFHFINHILNEMSNQGDLKQAELYWNIPKYIREGNSKNFENNYIMSFKPTSSTLLALEGFISPNKEWIRGPLTRPEEVIISYDEYKKRR